MNSVILPSVDRQYLVRYIRKVLGPTYARFLLRVMFPKLGPLCEKYTSSQLAYLSLGISLGLSISLISLFALRLDVVDLAASWLGDLYTYLIILGGFAAGILMQNHGRVPVIEFATLTLSLGWAVLCLSEMAFVLLYIGSALVASALGMIAPALCVHVIETYPLEVNQRFTAGTNILVGVLASFLLILFLHWRVTLFLLQIFTLLTYFSLRYHVLDSPVWLCSKKRFEEASSSFKQLGLGRTDNNADRHVLESRHVALRAERDATRVSQLKLIWYIFLQQMTNNHLLFYYVVKVGFPVDVAATTGYVLYSVVPSLMLGDTSTGAEARRRSSLIPTIVVCITYLMAAAYECKVDVSDGGTLFLHTCSLLNSSFGYLGGLYSLPWIMTVESTPTETRGFLTGILWVANYLIVRFWLQTYQLTLPFVQGCGISIVFLFMAFVTVLFHLYLWTESLERKSSLEVEVRVVESDVPRRNAVTSPV